MAQSRWPTPPVHTVGSGNNLRQESRFRWPWALPIPADIEVSAGNGRWEMISLAARAAYSYDPFTGEELWRVEERAQHSASTRPVLGHGMVYFPTGFSARQRLAVRPEATASSPIPTWPGGRTRCAQASGVSLGP